MKTFILLAGLILSFLLVPVAEAQRMDSLMKQAQKVFKPITALPELKGNKITPEKVELGKMLFFDPRISSSQVISCNTCHNLGMGGDDNLSTSIGHGWQRGPRNAPTVLNAVFNIAQFWDGRAKDLQAQAKGPIQAAVEMANTPQRVEETLASIPEYVAMFKKAFPKGGKPVSFDNMAMAIEAFETTLITPNSKFDKFLMGDSDALNELEREGLKTFMKKGCAACHNGVNVGGSGYFPFGVVKRPGADILPPEDKGRFAVTSTASQEYVFRAAPLRNVALTAPYFHSGNVWSLEQAIEVMGSSQLTEELEPQDVKSIAAFLHTLTGEQPSVVIPILPPSTLKTPRPQDMGQMR